MIRTFDQSRRFIFINHSRSDTIKRYHGRAVRLLPNNERIPFMALSSTKRCVSGVDTHTFQTMLIARSVFFSNGSVGLLMHQMTGGGSSGDSGDEGYDKEDERE